MEYNIKDMTYVEYYYNFGIFDCEKALELIQKRYENYLKIKNVDKTKIKKYNNELLECVNRIINKKVESYEEYDSLHRSAIICNSLLEKECFYKALNNKEFKKKSRYKKSPYSRIPELLGAVSIGSIFIDNWFSIGLRSLLLIILPISYAIPGIVFKDSYALLLALLLFILGIIVNIGFNKFFEKIAEINKLNRFKNRNMYHIKKDYSPAINKIAEVFLKK